MSDYTEDVFLGKYKNKLYGPDFETYTMPDGGIVPISEHVLDFHRNKNLGTRHFTEETTIADWAKDLLISKSTHKMLYMLYAAGDYVKKVNANTDVYQSNIEQYPYYDLYVSFPESFAEAGSGTPNQYAVMANFDYLYTNFYKQKLMVFFDWSDVNQRKRFETFFNNSVHYFKSLDSRVLDDELAYQIIMEGGFWITYGKTHNGFVENSVNSHGNRFFKKVAKGGYRNYKKKTHKNKRKKQHTSKGTRYRKRS